MVKIIKFQQKIKSTSHSDKYWGYNKSDVFACLECGLKYVMQNMLTYQPSNYIYTKAPTELYCIKCYNKKFS